MDPETEYRVRSNLFSAFADRAVLVISHRLTGLEQFDRLLLMQAGCLQQVSSEELINYFQNHEPKPEATLGDVEGEVSCR
jgi:ABC-type transport system involved in cytochrome bd biosynthesis fused ATPase/permease subunit